MHPSMEVLTERGWKLISNVQVSDRIASYTDDRRIVYVPIVWLWKSQYNGELVSVDQRRKGLIFKVTPGQRIAIDRQDANGSWTLKSADELKTDTIPRTGIWTGIECEYHDFDMPSGQGCGRNVNATQRMAMDDWLEFFGWWMSEGCAFRMDGGAGSPVISIRQTKPDHLPGLKALFQRLPWKYSLYTGGHYNIYSKQLFDVLHPIGNAHTKRIPRWIFALSKRQLRIFWDAFVKGDGHRGNYGETMIGLCNHGLINDLQEMAFLLGLVATKSHGIATLGFDTYGLYASKSRSATMIKRCQLQREHYQGDVWHIALAEAAAFLARFNGRYLWLGSD